MASKVSQNGWLGAFIIGGLVLAIGLVYYIGANQNLFGSTTQIESVFGNISGLQPGASVRFSGINVGTVEEIRITTDSTVLVGMRLDNSVVPYVKKDSKATIGSDGIMGDKVINITSGTHTTAQIEGGDKLVSVAPMEIDAIIAQAEKMVGSVSVLTNNLADISNDVKSGKGTIGMMLYDQQMANRMRYLLTGLNQTVGSLNKNLVNAQSGTEAFSENMKALQGNVLLRGYFKKKEKAKEKLEKDVIDTQRKIEESKQDSIEDVTKKQKRELRRKEKADRKAAKRLRKEQAKAIVEG
jgi:phospholipid/cholesterol/gamma-HCH transport system substrate-binding protein